MILRLDPSANADKETDSSVFDVSPLAAQTTIADTEIAALPLGNSIGSILENLDFSATANRIDVGGLWQTRPALFSARGGVSWQQNVYLLNGMDVSDPFWTGQPLWQPDVFALQAVGSSNAVLPAWASTPGGQLTLFPKPVTSEFHGGIWGFYSDTSLSSNNITPELREGRLAASDSINRLMDVNVHLSGPLAGGGPAFFTSWSLQSVDRALAGFAPLDHAALLSGLFRVDVPFSGNTLKLLWAGQSAADDACGAASDVDWSATSRQKILANILQVHYETKPDQPGYRRFGLSWAVSSTSDNPQAGITGTPRRDIFRDIARDAPAALESGTKHKLVLSFDGASLLAGFAGLDQRFEYGLQAKLSTASLTNTVPKNQVRLYEGDLPVEVAEYGGPFRFSASAFDATAYFQDTISFSNFLSLRVGLNAAFTYGWNGTSSIRWLTLSPRAELTLPLSSRRTSALKISAARYGAQLPLNYLMWGNPAAPGAKIYAWNDTNGNGIVDAVERGPLLRREGPAFSTIDSGIQRPSVDEFVLSYLQDLGGGWRLTLSGFIRETRNLIAAVNTGVTSADYSPVVFQDAGDDRISGDQDDLTFTLWNRSQGALGKDEFLLTNADAARRTSTYEGLDLTLTKAWDGKFFLSVALTAMHIVGTTNPGNTEWENDDGVIGSLYSDPNNAINANGRTRFDRAYTARIGLSAPLPLGTRLGLVAKYYDGQPFARNIIINDLNQGPLFIMAQPRGVSRYEFNMTVDARLEKTFRLGSSVLRILVDAFNVFNQNQAVEENEWTGPDYPRRFATQVQSPRVIRAGLNFEF